MESEHAINDTAHILRKLNDEKAALYLPVIVYIWLLLIVGTLGNILVFVVYIVQKRKSSSDYFIVSLAVLDLLSCVVGMPTEIVDLMYPYMFYSSAACKILRYTESCTVVSSALILVLVAFDRYFRICQISRVLTPVATKKICIALIIFGFIVSAPTGLIFGNKTIKTDVEGITGFDCSTEDWISSTIYPVIWYVFLFVTFVICLVIFSVLYILIGCRVWKRKHMTFGRRSGSDKHQVIDDIKSTMIEPLNVNNTNTEMCVEQELTLKANMIENDKVVRDEPRATALTEYDVGLDMVTRQLHLISVDFQQTPNSRPLTEDAASNFACDTGGCEVEKTRNDRVSVTSDHILTATTALDLKRGALNRKSKESTRSGSGLNPLRTTLILFVVTLVFILSFLPFLVAMVLRSANVNYEKNMSDTEEVIYKFCVKSIFINSSANPLIYSFLNATFRRQTSQKIARLFCKRL